MKEIMTTMMNEISDLYTLSDGTILLNHIIHNEDYELIKDAMTTYLMDNFSDRRTKVKVKLYDDEEDIIEMSKANLLTNIILLRSYHTFMMAYDKDMIFVGTKVSSDWINSYINNLIIEFDSVDYDTFKNDIMVIIKELVDVGYYSIKRYGNTMSLYGFYEFSKRNPEVRDLIHTKIPYGTDLYQSEKFVKAKLDRFVDLIKQDDKCIFYPYIMSKTGINIKQFGQMSINVGFKPDLFGRVIPDPINTNYLIGLDNIVQFYINASGARKALIVNKKKVKDSGYLNRKLSLLMLDHKLDPTVDDCGTTHYLRTEIRDQATLNRLNGKWYINEDKQELNLITDADINLIGSVVQMRSPIKCCLKDGKICKTCYSNMLGKVNEDKHTGIIAIILLTNVLSQILLSSKHRATRLVFK